jgi:hypothetical protein
MGRVTGLILGTAYVHGVGLCNVSQVKPGSSHFFLTPVEYHPTYTNSPLMRHRTRIDWRTVNPAYKEAS